MRSFLFVPAKEHMLAKIGTLGADAYIIDLEDSVEVEKKAQALALVEDFLNHFSEDVPLFVRLNKETFSNEADKLKSFSNVGFMLPKFENAEAYDVCSDVWNAHKVIALVETPLGIVNINQIAKCGWVDAIAFGAEDYTSAVNMENTPEFLSYQKSCIVTYAKAYGKIALDTPSFRIDNQNAFEEELQKTVKMGFDGKLAIAPRHVPYINNAFVKLSKEEMGSIIKQYEEAGKAVHVINGKVYERMHIDQLKQLLKD